MDETRIVFVDFHAAFDQLIVIGTGDHIDHLLVGDTGRHQPDIDASTGGQDESVDHVGIDDQIWCTDIAVIYGLIEDVHVDVLGMDLIIQRGLGIGGDVAVKFASDRFTAVGQEGAVFFS